MAETPEVSEEQLALILQLSRDFAFQQLAEAGHFIPFATQARPDGETEYVRVADETTQEPLQDIFKRLQEALIERVQQGEIIAAATVANVLVEGTGIEVEPGFEQALCVHVETAGFSRIVFVPYRVEAADEKDDKPYLVDAKMVAFETDPVIFAG